MAGIDVIIEDLSTHPYCPHGPTLLFSKKHKASQRSFYACSACRNRKLCSFFMWKDELRYNADKQDNKHQIVELQSSVKPKLLNMKLNEIKAVSEHKRMYCHTCSVLDITAKLDDHKKHNVVTNVSNYQLEHPTELLKPLIDSKKEAQYLFSKKCVQRIVEIVLKLGYKNVICIGTPRIFEYLLNNLPTKINTILLDLDSRFHNFFSPLEFCWFNLFNYHFFKKRSKEIFHNFLSSADVTDTILLLDPPFAGRVEPIAYTLEQFDSQFKNIFNTQIDLPILWFFPYFMEPYILNSMKNFVMLDYKVDYENHELFQQGRKGRKYGSPVRIFTNLESSSFILPEEDGYKFCSICKKWVYAENRHCQICNDCTSKDGQTYVHCNLCGKCVKPTWSHCKNCNRCAIKVHNCKELPFEKMCFTCNQPGHKKVDCPKTTSKIGNKRRKLR